MMWVSHETIYQALFVQGRGELRRELARCLRTGRAARRRRGRRENPGRVPNMVMVSDRPIGRFHAPHRTLGRLTRNGR